ncbi:MAG: guanine deaminase [Nitrospira sp.]|nr:guanine deaminase [Nitrospira sp.]
MKSAIRAGLLTFRGDPFVDGPAARCYEPDAIVVMENGRVADCGPAGEVRGRLGEDVEVTHYANALITAGFIDSHVHYPQLPIIGAGGKPLLDWLSGYAFAAEERFAGADYARRVARAYLRENLRNGITTAAVFCTVHAISAEVLFEEASALDLRLVAGKLLMDRNAPTALLDTAQRGYDESKALIGRWHGKGRLGYAVTPRFAATSTPAQLDAAGALKREHPGVHVQSHVSESRAEVALVASLYPEASSYLDVYARHGLTGPRTIYGHGVHLAESDFAFLHATGTAIAHCPTSNSFLGSGLFSLATAVRGDRPVRVGLATDVGGGTSLSILRTMQAAYEVAQLSGAPLAPSSALYLATRGAARALDLDAQVGSVAPGMEADLVVLDLRSTAIVALRMEYARDLDEVLAIQMALGDDRAVRATYVAGRKRYDRDAREFAM